MDASEALRELVAQEPALSPLLESHLKDNFGELLSTLFIAEVIDWTVRHRQTDPEVGVHVIEWMNDRYGSASEQLKDVIVTGGVEAIPNPGEAGSELRDLLSTELRSLDPWSDQLRPSGENKATE